MRTLHHLVLSGALLCGTTRAQCPPSLSFFAGAPNALSLADDAAVPFDRTKVYRHGPGFHAAAPSEWSAAPGAVHFDLRAAMLACGAAAAPDIDGLSLGLDFLPVDDSTGEVVVPQNQWALLSFSVSRTSIGKPGTVIRTEASRSDGAGADVFTYVLPGSALPPDLVDRTTRAQDSREIDLGTGALREIDALDQFMPMYSLEPALVAQLPPNPTVLFSVSAATLAQVPITWWAGTTPSAATILKMVFVPPATPSQIGTWTCPGVFLRYDQLGLLAGEDVDALAVDLPNQRVVFSTKSPARDELLFVYYGTDGGTVDAMTLKVDGTNDKVEDKAGLEVGDDVDAVCGIDPSVRSTPTAFNVAYFSAATPKPKVFPHHGTVQASCFKGYGPTGPYLRSMLVGWPPLSGPGPGLALCVFSPPDQLGPFVSLLGEVRSMTAVFCGDPRVLTLAVPPAMTLSDFQFDLRWFVANSTVTELEDAYPLRIHL